MSSLFDLPKAETLLCHLLGYNRSGSFLEIKIYPEVGDDPICYLRFEGVVYFDGPVFWQGARFERGSDVECLALLRELGIHNDLPGDDLVGQFSLYTLKMAKSHRQVRIIAIHVMRDDQPSGKFI